MPAVKSKSLSRVEVYEMLSKLSRKWILYIHFVSDDWPEVVKATGDLLETDHVVDGKTLPDFQVLCQEFGVYLFDTEEEVGEAYDKVVGDDGPTDSNPYDGPARVYAEIICPERGIITHNT